MRQRRHPRALDERDVVVETSGSNRSFLNAVSPFVNRSPGRHFLQLPGPSNVPDRILNAMHRNTIDHRGPAFQAMLQEVLTGMQGIFNTNAPVLIYPSSATGAWEAALCNTLSPGDQVLVFDRGHFSLMWSRVAERLGLRVSQVAGDWRLPVTGNDVRSELERDDDRRIRAVLVVHNETSTGVTSDVAAIRSALTDLEHPALLMVDTVSSLAATDYRHDEWGVDVCISGSQKALMLPPGLSFAALSERALEANAQASLPRSYWDWQEMLRFNADGFFPYTPATGLLFGLREALQMIEEEGLETVFARHARHSRATRAAVSAWELENYCAEPTACSHAATSVKLPMDASSERLRHVLRTRCDLSVGGGLGKLKDRVFRIGHLGDLNDVTLLGALAGVELGLRLTDTPHEAGGVDAALQVLADPPAPLH